MAEEDQTPKKQKLTGTSEKNVKDYLESIHSHLESLSKIYYGTVNKESIGASDWGLFVKSSNCEDAARFMLLKNMTEADGQWCMNNLEKSYYSNDNVKTLDESFRKSVSSKTFALCGGVDSLLNYLKDEIFESDDIVIRPYKFNCHGEGCFFQTHKDTHSDVRLIGTLILIPCSTFEGGDLSFPIQSRSVNLSTGARSGCLQFVYFDIQYSHAVTPVESGFRFSLVFNVYAGDFDYQPRPLIETHMVSDESIKSVARDIYEVFKNEKNILFYDVFDSRIASELREIFPNSIDVFFGEEDPDVVYDSYDCVEDYSSGDSDGDEDIRVYPDGDFCECVYDAISYQVNHIIGKASKLIAEQLTQSSGGNSPCSYLCKVDYFKGILLNPSDPQEPN